LADGTVWPLLLAVMEQWLVSGIAGGASKQAAIRVCQAMPLLKLENWASTLAIFNRI
jgi:hypothetical protein